MIIARFKAKVKTLLSRAEVGLDNHLSHEFRLRELHGAIPLTHLEKTWSNR